MSRRIAFLVLAALAALIATPASADPECFGESCRLPEVVEPPAEAVPPPDPGDAAAPEAAAPEASAAVEKPAPVKALPQVVTSQVAKPKVTAAPVVRAPIPPMPPMRSVADETSALREPVQLAPRSLKDAPEPADVTNAPPADHARSVRVSSPDPSYVVGHNTPAVGAIVVVAPGHIYGSGRAPVYMIAPSAKIISIDSDD